MRFNWNREKINCILYLYQGHNKMSKKDKIFAIICFIVLICANIKVQNSETVKMVKETNFGDKKYAPVDFSKLPRSLQKQVK